MLRYPIVSSFPVRLNLWVWKCISLTTDMTQTSYIQRPMYLTPLILKLKLREKYDFRLWTKGLWHAKISNFTFISCKGEFMGLEKISHTTDMTQTSYIQRPMYMTPLILKLKLREKSDFRLWTEGLRHAKISTCSFISCKVEFMGLEKNFTHYRYDANFLHPTSYVYDPTNTKTETKGEIWL